MSKVDREIVEMLERPVDVKRLVDKLFFNQDDLERAAIKQPQLFLESGRFRAQQALELARLKRKLGKVSAKIGIRLRKRGSYKTEKAITERLNQNGKIQHYQDRIDRLEVIVELAHQLSKAYEERMMVLSILTRIYAAETNSGVRSVEGKEIVDKMRKKAHTVRKRFREFGDEDV